LIGCTTKRERVEQRQESSDKSPVTTPPDGASRGISPTPDRAVMDTVSSVAEIFSRIHEYESILSQIIAAGRLGELGADAARVSEFLAMAELRAQIPPDQRGDFEGHVSAAKRAAGALGEAGKAGNLEDAKARNADLQRELGIVERLARAGA
jgi:hypothetical protein